MRTFHALFSEFENSCTCFWHPQTQNALLAPSTSRLYLENTCDKRLLPPLCDVLFVGLLLLIITFLIQSPNLPRLHPIHQFSSVCDTKPMTKLPDSEGSSQNPLCPPSSIVTVNSLILLGFRSQALSWAPRFCTEQSSDYWRNPAVLSPVACALMDINGPCGTGRGISPVLQVRKAAPKKQPPNGELKMVRGEVLGGKL